MKSPLIILCGLCLSLTIPAGAQTVRTWTSDSDQRWSRNGNWSGNRPNNSGESAEFGTGTQLNPELNSNSYTIRGISFSSGADSYNVGDDNGSRTLRIGNFSSGFIENLSANDQAISIATLQFQSDATISTTGGGNLSLTSDLTGFNRDLTFDAFSDISVGGSIATGGGTLTKQGGGNLNLSGTNTYSGITSINNGAIVLGASNVFNDASTVSISAGAALKLNDYADVIGQLSGAGEVDFGLAGTGQLTLGTGLSAFSGSFTGSGELVIGTGAVLSLGADFSNPNLNITLAGGTLLLGGHSLTLGTLNVAGTSVIDFDLLADSELNVNSLGFESAGLGLAVVNWTDASDYFFSQTGYAQGTAPLEQIIFAGWSAADTKWQSYDSQVTPVPEPSAYGACLMAMALLGWYGRKLAQRGAGENV